MDRYKLPNFFKPLTIAIDSDISLACLFLSLDLVITFNRGL